MSRSPLHIATENTENTAAEDTRILRQTAMMISLWNGVTFPPEDGTLDMKLSDYGLNRGEVRGVLNHFQNCKDCAGILNSFLPHTLHTLLNILFNLIIHVYMYYKSR